MRTTRSQAGFSLVEVLCAIVILGVALAGLTTGIVTALRNTKESELQTAAVFFAAGLIETLRAEGYLLDGETDGECGDALPSCRWRQTISGAQIEGLHEVSVVLERSDTGKTVFELRTLLFEPPLLTSSTGSSDRDATRARERQNRRQ